MNPRSFQRASSDFGDEQSPEAAYQRLLPDIARVRQDDLVKISLDVPRLVAAVLGVLPGVRGLREAAAGLVASDFDIGQLDRLEDCALALSHAHARHAALSRLSDDLAELNMEALQTRERLYSVASSMSRWNALDPASLRGYTGLAGYKRVAADVLLLVTVFRSRWETLQGRCPCEPDDFDRAEKLAIRMLRLAGQREKSSASIAEAADTRARAYALLFQYYDSVRRAVTFLRWKQGDADDLAPSLYTTRRPRSAKRKPPAAEPPPAQAVADEAPAPAPPQPTGSTAPATTDHPGGSPFID